MNHKQLSFIHISDTHIGSSREYRMDGRDTFRTAQKLVDVLNAFPEKFDFVLHTGDITAKRMIENYSLVEEVFGALKIPLYVAAGNHDAVPLVRKHLNLGSSRALTEQSIGLNYVAEFGGIGLIVLDAQLPDPETAHGSVPDIVMEALQKELECRKDPCVVAVHFPPLPTGCPWVDEEMLMQNGAKLHALLSSYKDIVRGVFLGHIHRAFHHQRDGLSYFAAPSLSVQFEIFPHTKVPAGNPLEQPGFSFVRVSQSDIFVTQHFLP